jgi:protein-L-isoaspartate(D-aspartate) O-methyltransferase
MNIEFARQQMVQQQIRAWDVLDEDILDVFRTVPRERFVPAGFESLAFAETDIPIGRDEHMLTPVIEGRILEALKPSASERALEIGVGTGFLTACLATLARNVVGIDIHDDFVVKARHRLEALGIGNVELHTMDGTTKLPDGPFDLIVVGGSIERLDQHYIDALAPAGRMFVVVGTAPTMEARLVTHASDGGWQNQVLFETRLKPLRNGTLPATFLF